MRRATLGDRHPSTLNSINNLGQLLQAKGDLTTAEPLLREALEVSREVLGNRHPSTLISINNLGTLLNKKGDLAAAEPLYREALGVHRATLGNRHPLTHLSIINLSRLLVAKGDLAAAEPFGDQQPFGWEARDVWRSASGHDHRDDRQGTRLAVRGAYLWLWGFFAFSRSSRSS